MFSDRSTAVQRIVQGHIPRFSSENMAINYLCVYRQPQTGLLDCVHALNDRILMIHVFCSSVCPFAFLFSEATHYSVPLRWNDMVTTQNIRKIFFLAEVARNRIYRTTRTATALPLCVSSGPTCHACSYLPGTKRQSATLQQHVFVLVFSAVVFGVGRYLAMSIIHGCVDLCDLRFIVPFNDVSSSKCVMSSDEIIREE